jgi:hypothetical protein
VTPPLREKKKSNVTDTWFLPIPVLSFTLPGPISLPSVPTHLLLSYHNFFCFELSYILSGSYTQKGHPVVLGRIAHTGQLLDQHRTNALETSGLSTSQWITRVPKMASLKKFRLRSLPQGRRQFPICRERPTSRTLKQFIELLSPPLRFRTSCLINSKHARACTSNSRQKPSYRFRNPKAGVVHMMPSPDHHHLAVSGGWLCQ